MKNQTSHTIFFMSFCSALGIVGVLIFMSVKEPEGLEPKIVWNGNDKSLRLVMYSKCEGKIQERIPTVKVVKKDRGTVTTIRSYVSELSSDVFYQAKFTSDSYDPWKKVALCWLRNGRDRSEISESAGRWGPV